MTGEREHNAGPSGNGRDPNRARRWQQIKLALAIAAIAGVLWYIDLPPAEKLLQPWLVLAVVAGALGSLGTIAFNGWRHGLLACDPPAPFLLAFKSVVLSGGLNFFVPGRLAEVIKVSYLRENLNIRIAHGLTAVALERTLDVIILGLLTGLTVVSSLLKTVIWLPILGMACAVGLVALPLLVGPVRALLVRYPNQVARFVIAAIDHYRTVARMGRLGHLLVLSVGFWATALAACVVFLQMQPLAPISLWQACLIFVATHVAIAIPGPPGGLGLFQLAVVLVLTPAGVATETAIVLGILLQFSTMLPLFLLTPIILVREPTGVAGLLADARAGLRTARLPEGGN